MTVLYKIYSKHRFKSHGADFDISYVQEMTTNIFKKPTWLIVKGYQWSMPGSMISIHYVYTMCHPQEGSDKNVAMGIMISFIFIFRKKSRLSLYHNECVRYAIWINHEYILSPRSPVPPMLTML